MKASLTEGFAAQVVATFGRRCEVRDESGAVHAARPLGRALELVCGDRVSCTRDAKHDEVYVGEVLPRRTALYRSNARGESELLVANLDVLLVVVAARPRCDFFVLDRYLSAAQSAGIEAAIVLNKSDLAESASLMPALRPFCALGYELLVCSAHDRSGSAHLHSSLAQRLGAFVGQSGVGKSSLVALVAPQAAARTGALDRQDVGRHTTTAARLYATEHGGMLIDSPGVRDFAPSIEHLDASDLGFVEVSRAAPRCRFADCRHLQEPACAVREAVGTGEIGERRYESYRRLRRLCEELRARRGNASR